LKLPKYCMKLIERSSLKLTVYDITFYTHPNVYTPSDDTYLLMDSLEIIGGERFLDLGCGTGIVGIYAAKKGAREIIQLDINPYAVLLARCNSALNNVDGRTFSVVGNMFDPIAENYRFDIIAFNPPYLPVSDEGLIGKSWSGGASGREVVDAFLKAFDKFLSCDGKVYLINSSLSNYNLTLKILDEKGFSWRIVSRKKFFFEEIVCIEAWRKC